MHGFSSRAAVLVLAALAVGGFVQTAQAQVGDPLCVMNIDGTEMREVALVPGAGIGSPSWSADGKFIAFDAAEPGFRNQHVFVVELATGEITDLGRGGFASFAPDSERVAYHAAGRGVGRRVWIANRDGSGAKVLIDEGSHPRFSPDGKLVAYRSPRGDNMGIYDVETGEHHELFDEPTSKLSWGRAWSPDGERMAIRRDGPGGSHELVLVNSAGSSRGLKVRYRGNLSSHVSWSRDGSQLMVGIYFPGEGPRHLHLMDPDSREKPVLIPGQDIDYDYCDGTFSPDGKQVAFGYQLHVKPK